MTLKSLFLTDGQKKKKHRNTFVTDIFENMKRRNWVFWLSFLTFLCYFPGYLVLALNNLRSSYQGTDELGMVRMQERMIESVENLFLLNGFMPVLIIGLAVVTGMQGFVYLHHKKQVDFYHSQPVSRNRRFWVLWINGISIFIITYLLNMILGIMVAATFGSMTPVIITEGIKAFILYLLLFLGVYNLSVIAVLLTGNTLVSLLAILVLLGYELSVRVMNVVMASSFFITYGDGEEEKIFDTIFSPIVSIYKYIILGGKEYHYWQYTNENYSYGKTVFVLFFLAAVFGAVSNILYRIRASESHGNSISFPKIKEGLRFALLLLTGIFGNYFVYYVAGENVVLGIVGAVFFVGLGHAVLQLIYEADFRAIRKKWFTATISLMTVILVFLGYKYDWIGFDSRIPKQSEVESVYVSLIAEGFGDTNFVMPDGTEIYYHSYKRKEMEIRDLDTIYELLEKREKIHKNTTDFSGTYDSIELIFRMKNKNTEHRRFYLKYEENMDLLDKIYHMEEYQRANNQIWEDNFANKYRIVSASYDNGLQEKEISSINMETLLEAYKKDVQNAGYEEVYYNFPIGRITFSGIGLQKEEYRNTWDILIYDSYKNTIDLLDNSGVSPRGVYDEVYINTIEKIEVRYEDNSRMQSGNAFTWNECHKTAIYTNQGVYQQILKNAVPSSNRRWGASGRNWNDGVYVYIYTANPYDRTDYYMEEVSFQRGEIPQFIIEDLENIPYGKEVIIP